MKYKRLHTNYWDAGGGMFSHTEFEIDGYSIHRRKGSYHLGSWVEYWVDFRPDAIGIVPENATLMNPYSCETGWLSFKNLRDAYCCLAIDNSPAL